MSIKLKISNTFQLLVVARIQGSDGKGFRDLNLTVTYHYLTKSQRKEMGGINDKEALQMIIADIDGLPIDNPEELELTVEMKIDAIVDHPIISKPIMDAFNNFHNGTTAQQVAARKN